MPVTGHSVVRDLPAADGYVELAAPHDAGAPEGEGFGKRFEFSSVIGNCGRKTFVPDVRANAVAHGKAGLKVEAHHFLLSWSHEEFDPNNILHGTIAHGMAEKWVKRACPGHQAKLVTQRDNGKWVVDENGEEKWEPGKWHTHLIVANVAEQSAVLRYTGRDGVERVRHSRAGHAAPGWMTNINRLKAVTDELVRQELGYDNAEYVRECGEKARERVSAKDYRQREERGYSSSDEVRVKLAAAKALAVSWDDYTDRLAASAVTVKVRGKSGVSYGWVGEDGVEHAERAAKLSREYTLANVTKQAEQNAAAVARGEVLVAPEPELVPARTAPADRPRPIYFNGAPAWEPGNDELAELSARLSGPTFAERDSELTNRATMIEEFGDQTRAALDAREAQLADRESAWERDERPKLVASAKAQGRAAGESEAATLLTDARAQQANAASAAAAAATDQRTAQEVLDRIEEHAEALKKEREATAINDADETGRKYRDWLRAEFKDLKHELEYTRESAGNKVIPGIMVEIMHRRKGRSGQSMYDSVYEEAEQKYRQEYGGQLGKKDLVGKDIRMTETVAERHERFKRQRGSAAERAAPGNTNLQTGSPDLADKQEPERNP